LGEKRKWAPPEKVGFDHDDDEEEGERVAAKSILWVF
jgi:hypothetical protein